ncbi:MAG: beta-lactamase family protein [Nocardioidaceae bacterium]|nr:MAG: beta-lactamase family protein [Nocardioidaceae bacterium]
MRSATRDLATAATQNLAQRHPDAVVGVLDETGEPTFAGAGESSPDERSLFEIGSISKVFTALVLADEVIRGNLSLDQPVRELLPPETVLPSRGGTEITLAHLATHTSGLPRMPLKGLRPWLGFLGGHNPYAPVTPDVLLDRLAGTKLSRTPGTGKIAYSNFGFGLLGLALVNATGALDYEQLIVDRVCKPLGLTDTAVHVGDIRLLPGHRRRGSADPWLLTGIAGAGALRSCAADLITFLAAQLDPDSTPLGEAIRLTHAEQVPGIGLGWMLATKPNLLIWHNGGTGGYRCFAGFLPEKDIAVVVLANSVRSVDLAALRLIKDLSELSE